MFFRRANEEHWIDGVIGSLGDQCGSPRDRERLRGVGCRTEPGEHLISGPAGPVVFAGGEETQDSTTMPLWVFRRVRNGHCVIIGGGAPVRQTSYVRTGSGAPPRPSRLTSCLVVREFGGPLRIPAHALRKRASVSVMRSRSIYSLPRALRPKASTKSSSAREAMPRPAKNRPR